MVTLEAANMPNKSLDLINTVGQWLQNWWFRERSKEHSTDFTRDRAPRRRWAC